MSKLIMEHDTKNWAFMGDLAKESVDEYSSPEHLAFYQQNESTSYPYSKLSEFRIQRKDFRPVEDQMRISGILDALGSCSEVLHKEFQDILLEHFTSDVITILKLKYGLTQENLSEIEDKYIRKFIVDVREALQA